jgi:hypothetical protein
MKKLDDIPKNDIFKVPDGYFDTLPTIIQARVEKKESAWLPAFRISLRYALPVLLVAVGILWFTRNSEPTSSPEELLASISSNDLIEYIQEADMSTDDLLESIDYTMINADSLDLNDSNVLLTDEDLNEVLTEFETEL